jgi:hypothetical protein
MSELEQVPFGEVDFAENPEPRCPCLLLLDTSASMRGRKIDELNAPNLSWLSSPKWRRRRASECTNDVSQTLPIGSTTKAAGRSNRNKEPPIGEPPSRSQAPLEY